MSTDVIGASFFVLGFGFGSLFWLALLARMR